MSVKQHLIEAKARVQAGWTKGVLARDKAGMPVSPTSGYQPVEAVCFCSLGAIYAGPVETCREAESLLYEEVVTRTHYKQVSTFNDQSNKAAVLAMFEAAIQAADE